MLLFRGLLLYQIFKLIDFHVFIWIHNFSFHLILWFYKVHFEEVICRYLCQFWEVHHFIPFSFLFWNLLGCLLINQIFVYVLFVYGLSSSQGLTYDAQICIRIFNDLILLWKWYFGPILLLYIIYGRYDMLSHRFWVSINLFNVLVWDRLSVALLWLTTCNLELFGS